MFVPVALDDVTMPFALKVPPFRLIVWLFRVRPTRTCAEGAEKVDVSLSVKVEGPFQWPNMTDEPLLLPLFAPVTVSEDLPLSVKVAGSVSATPGSSHGICASTSPCALTVASLRT